VCKRDPAVCSDAAGMKTGAPGGTRTPNFQIRSLMLYPIELQAQQGFEPMIELFAVLCNSIFRTRPQCALFLRIPSQAGCMGIYGQHNRRRIDRAS
jgi:hypothetical protein